MINKFNNEEIANIRDICIKLIKEILDINIDKDKLNNNNDNLNIDREESIGDEEEVQIIESENILKDGDEDVKENSNGDELVQDKMEKQNLFDIEISKKRKVTKPNSQIFI